MPNKKERMDNIKVTDENVEKVQMSEIEEKLLKSQNPYMTASLEKEMTFTIPITALVAVMVFYIS